MIMIEFDHQHPYHGHFLTTTSFCSNLVGQYLASLYLSFIILKYSSIRWSLILKPSISKHETHEFDEYTEEKDHIREYNSRYHNMYTYNTKTMELQDNSHRQHVSNGDLCSHQAKAEQYVLRDDTQVIVEANGKLYQSYLRISKCKD